jgi:hypothetical protein
MSRAEFIVSFDGPGVRDGRIDVRDLAPALLSLGRLVDAANVAINGQDRPMKVEVRAVSVGCFEVHLDAVLSGWKYVRSLLESSDVQAAKNLLEWVGIFVGTPSLIQLYRWLDGEKPQKVIREIDGYFQFEIDGKTLRVPFEVMRLYQEISVNRAIGELLTTLEGDSVDRIDFRSPDMPASTPAQTLTRADRRVFTITEPAPEIIIDEARRLALSIRSLAFQEGNKWRLFDGQNTITATIEDRLFIDRVDQNLERFAKGDVLICEVRTIQMQGREGLKTEHSVLKVIEHKPAPAQIALPFQDG